MADNDNDQQQQAAAPAEPQPRINIICAKCGSDDVRADAYGAWSTDTQEWELATTFDKGAVCEVCGGETTLEEVELSETPEALMARTERMLAYATQKLVDARAAFDDARNSVLKDR